MKRILPLLSLLVFLTVFTPALAQQTQPDVLEANAEYRFAESVTFYGKISHAEKLREVFIIFQAQGEPQTRVEPIGLEANGSFSHRYDMRQNYPLRPFAEVRFWFRLNLQDGSTRDSKTFSFAYTDNRFAWQMLEAANLRVHWYSGDLVFGQAALDVAQKGIARSQQVLPAAPQRVLDVYIYANAADLQPALEFAGRSWVAGHASVGLGVAVVSITPGLEQNLEMRRQIPHELMHLYLYEMLGERYGSLPYWLGEGLPSLVELDRNPDYDNALATALSKNNLLSMQTLCESFPPDLSGRYLAYAQSESFTRHLLDTYGTSGMEKLLRAYADGVKCDPGMQRALGISLSQAESDWRAESLGENRLWRAAQNMLPYLCLLGLLLLAPASRIFFGGKPHAAQSK